MPCEHVCIQFSLTAQLVACVSAPDWPQISRARWPPLPIRGASSQQDLANFSTIFLCSEVQACDRLPKFTSSSHLTALRPVVSPLPPLFALPEVAKPTSLWMRSQSTILLPIGPALLHFAHVRLLVCHSNHLTGPLRTSTVTPRHRGWLAALMRHEPVRHHDKAPLSARFAGFRLSPLSPSTSGAGPSGLRPEDVKEALRSCTGDTMLRLLGEVVALMLQCQVLVSVPACLWSDSRNPLLKIASPHKNRSAAGTTRRHAPDHQIAVQDWSVPNLRLTLRVFFVTRPLLDKLGLKCGARANNHTSNDFAPTNGRRAVNMEILFKGCVTQDEQYALRRRVLQSS